MENSDLQRLADASPISVLRCKATSTTKKYLGAYKRWKAWATAHNLTAFPANEAHVALYLQHLAEDKSSKAAVEEAVNGLAWVHAEYVGQSKIGSSLPLDLCWFSEVR